MEEKLLNIIPDFYNYYLITDIEDYDSKENFIISNIEHEIEIYINWKEEGFENQQEVSYINKTNIKKIKNLLKNYYKEVKK